MLTLVLLRANCYRVNTSLSSWDGQQENNLNKARIKRDKNEFIRRTTKPLCGLLLVEFVGIITAIWCLIVVQDNGSLDITDNLFVAKCFSRAGDEAVLEIKGQLESFAWVRTTVTHDEPKPPWLSCSSKPRLCHAQVTVIEMIADVIAFGLHFYEVYVLLNDDDSELDPKTAFLFSAVIDLGEFAMAIISLFVFLRGAFTGFEDLYDAMGEKPVESSVDPMPCIYTSCSFGGMCDFSDFNTTAD